ncbi:MAG: hypothetical protein ABIC57_00655 [bacterium]
MSLFNKPPTVEVIDPNQVDDKFEAIEYPSEDVEMVFELLAPFASDKYSSEQILKIDDCGCFERIWWTVLKERDGLSKSDYYKEEEQEDNVVSLIPKKIILVTGEQDEYGRLYVCEFQKDIEGMIRNVNFGTIRNSNDMDINYLFKISPSTWFKEEGWWEFSRWYDTPIGQLNADRSSGTIDVKMPSEDGE